tara:strand:+ start:152 stop:844 length:693 start_codon:yes stop_codon:yes gene_type:complete
MKKNKSKKKILLVGGSSKVGISLIENIDKKKFQIYSTYNKKKLNNKKILQYKLDLSSKNSFSSFVNSVKDLDIIVLLSGDLKGKKLLNFDDEEIENNFKINFLSQIILLKKLLKKQKKKCTLIAISSISGRKGSFDPIYASAKGAMISLIKSISKWEAPKIRCIGLCPGIILNTKIYKNFNKARLKFSLSQNPNKEFLNSEDLAKIIIDITKPHWRHANGTIIDINGGVF